MDRNQNEPAQQAQPSSAGGMLDLHARQEQQGFTTAAMLDGNNIDNMSVPMQHDVRF